MAALSAGMVLSHSPLKDGFNLQASSSQPSVTVGDNLNFTNVQTVLDNPSSICYKNRTDMGENGADEYHSDQDYNNENPIGNKSTIIENNYAKGSYCLNSGLLLRQGIILRGMGSRAESSGSVLPPPPPAPSSSSTSHVLTSKVTAMTCSSDVGIHRGHPNQLTNGTKLETIAANIKSKQQPISNFSYVNEQTLNQNLNLLPVKYGSEEIGRAHV